MIIGLILLLLIGSNIFLIKERANLIEDKDRMTISIQKQLKQKDDLIEVSRRDFKMLMKGNLQMDSLLKQAKTKLKNVNSYTKIKVITKIERDTVPVPVFIDSENFYNFNYDRNCLSFDATLNVEKMEATLSNIEQDQVIELLSYLKKEKTGRKFLWIFNINRKYLELHTKSKCGKVEVRQLNIIKEK